MQHDFIGCNSRLALMSFCRAIGTKSKWANYISVLPKEIQTPIYLAPNVCICNSIDSQFVCFRGLKDQEI